MKKSINYKLVFILIMIVLIIIIISLFIFIKSNKNEEGLPSLGVFGNSESENVCNNNGSCEGIENNEIAQMTAWENQFPLK